MKIILFLLFGHHHTEVVKVTPTFKVEQTAPNTLHMNEGDYVLYKKYMKDLQSN